MLRAVPRMETETLGFAFAFALAFALPCVLAACDLSAYNAIPRKRDVDQTVTAQAVSEPLPQAPAVAGLTAIDAPALLERVRGGSARGVLVNVWASWCGSCKRELPLLLQLRETFQPGIELLLVSADEPEGQAAAVEVLESAGAPLPSLLVSGSLGVFKRALHPDWAGALPATFLFDAQGKRRYFWEGPVYEHELTPILQGFLAGEPIDGEARPELRGGPTPAR